MREGARIHPRRDDKTVAEKGETEDMRTGSAESLVGAEEALPP